MNVVGFRAAMLVLFGLGLLVVDPASAVPRPAPKYWSVARCERVLPEQHPAIGQVICVASGDRSTCRWTSGHRGRLYSELTVFEWFGQANFTTLGMDGVVPGVVRSFTLATRDRPGFARIYHLYGDRYVGWPADFFVADVRLLATEVPPGRFRSIVAPIAARLMQKETANCTGG